MSERRQELAHFGHVELLTPRPEDSLAFFTDVLGLTVSGYGERSVYLRARGDYELHTLKLTEADRCGIGHIAWRMSSDAALERRAAALERSGAGLGWSEGDLGHGRAYRARAPEGRTVEIYHDTRWHDDAHDAAPPSAPGCNILRIDHVTLAAGDIAQARGFLETALGLGTSERVEIDGVEAEGRLTSNNKFCDIALTRAGGPDRPADSLAYVVNSSEDVRRAAHVCIEHHAPIETGPRHPVHQTVFLQVREPGGNDLEICCPGARLVLAPDWRPIVRIESARPSPRWGLRTVSS